MKSIFEENGGTYSQVGDVLIPDLVMDPQPEGEIGLWGWRRKRYLQEHRKGVYNAMLLNGTLTKHLIDTNEAALDYMETLVKQTAKAEGVTEELKKQNQMEWVRRMNSLRNRAEEIVRNDLIYS
ncbi:MAG: TnpV protein [Clostridia bacterium]|nr:TnpV protein [Clostridia bacterium]MBR0206096.1 TnpV protein [Clostridia bacterium]